MVGMSSPCASATTISISRLVNCSNGDDVACLLYTSDAADERSSVDLGGRRIIKKKKKKKIRSGLRRDSSNRDGTDENSKDRKRSGRTEGAVGSR